jgi:hypothetical protein
MKVLTPKNLWDTNLDATTYRTNSHKGSQGNFAVLDLVGIRNLRINLQNTKLGIISKNEII